MLSFVDWVLAKAAMDIPRFNEGRRLPGVVLLRPRVPPHNGCELSGAASLLRP